MKTDKYWEVKAIQGYEEAKERCMKLIAWKGRRSGKAYRQLEYAITHVWRPRLDKLAAALHLPGYEMIRLTQN